MFARAHASTFFIKENIKLHCSLSLLGIRSDRATVFNRKIQTNSNNSHSSDSAYSFIFTFTSRDRERASITLSPVGMASTAKTTTHVPSTRALFYALDQKTTSREKVLEKLNAATPFLQQGLKAYGPNSAASKAALESGSIDVGGKTIAVGADLQKCTVMLAQLLKLDEIQTYVMLRRALEEKGITARPKEVTGELIELVCTFYHRERLALLKCVAVLGTQKAYVFDGENDDGFGGNEKEGEEAEFAFDFQKSSKR